jgi:hypothetical protein
VWIMLLERTCVCVCVYERERERGTLCVDYVVRESVCVYNLVDNVVYVSVCVCLCVCMCVCVQACG